MPESANKTIHIINSITYSINFRLERNSLKSALDSAHQEDKAKAIEAARKEWTRSNSGSAANASMRKVSVENEAFKSDISKLRQQIATTEQKMVNAVNEAKREGEQKVSEPLFLAQDCRRNPLG